jgi:hypothetical protein
MRSHLPSNEITAEKYYSPIYHDTKKRYEQLFGGRNPQFWPAKEQTCSGCYSVVPKVGAKPEHSA